MTDSSNTKQDQTGHTDKHSRMLLDYQNMIVEQSDLLKNQTLLKKIKDEVQYSEEPDKDASTLLIECL